MNANSPLFRNEFSTLQILRIGLSSTEYLCKELHLLLNKYTVVDRQKIHLLIDTIFIMFSFIVRELAAVLYR